MARFDVTIAGELNLDLILYGLPEILEPERELLANDMMLTLGSSSAIVAHNLASLGSKVGFISCIGDDQFGQMALERLSAAGVDISKVSKIFGSVKTGLTVLLQHNKWRNILTYPGTIFDLKLEHLDFDYLTSSRHFHFSSYYLQRGLQSHVVDLFKKLRSKGVTISLDCNDDPDDEWGGLEAVLPHVDIFLPNEREATRIAGTENVEAAIDKLAAMVPLLVVKLGSKGALARRGKEQVSSPGVKVDLIDPVGAGDSFDAGFLHEYLRGSDLATCLKSGNIAGALSVTRPGGTEAFRDAGHRERFLKQHR
ncbi:MAG TPA: carbohydrate kinase family protein [Terriglobales bacterium]